MKNIIYLLTVVILASCASSNDVVSNNHLIKRKYRKGWHISNKGSFNKTAIASSDNELSKKGQTVEYASSEHPDPLLSSLSSPIEDYTSNNVSIHSRKNVQKQEGECTEIIKRNGDIIEAQILEVGVSEIKYKKCSNLEGPTYSILKSTVFMLKYKNGDKDVFNEESTPSKSATGSDDQQIEPFSMVSFITGMTGLVLGLFLSIAIGIFLGVLAIVFGAISLNRIKRNPDKYSKKSSKWAKSGLITGLVITTLSTLLLVLIVMF